MWPIADAPLGILTATALRIGSFSLLLPMVIAGVTAMLIPQILGNSPIYDSLKERTLRLDAVCG